MNPLFEVLLFFVALGAIIAGEKLAKKVGIKSAKPDKKGGDKHGDADKGGAKKH